MNDSRDKIEDFIVAVENKIRAELRKRCEVLAPDFLNPAIFTVLLALLARQATLTIELARAPQLWNGHSAPLFLRAMADLHITFSWIAVEPEIRAKQYIEHGLGQAVLMQEHRKANIDNASDEDKEAIQKVIDFDETWINIQKFTFLVDVNVGAWSGKNTRVMAEEAGILDFYNNVYVPFSQCAHNTWHHVGRYNSHPSDSPLNRLLWKPIIFDQHPDVWELHLLSKYLDKTFNVFDKRIMNGDEKSNIHDWIYQEIQNSLVEKVNGTPEQQEKKASEA